MFQSTPSGGKATVTLSALDPSDAVSIHAFRGEGDLDSETTAASRGRFNPRLPGGRRPAAFLSDAQRPRCFNPRLPGGRRQTRSSTSICWARFQSTPSGGKATGYQRSTILGKAFQSTPSGGKATRHNRLMPHYTPVSIHAFRGEGDLVCLCAAQPFGVSIHAFRGEGDKRRHNTA